MLETSLIDDQVPFAVRENKSPAFLEVVGYVPPLSLQASKARKRPYMAALRKAVKDASSLVFLGDVKVEIDWYIDQHRRYSTNKVADIDNIVKPLLDSVSGEGGVLIDDGQVQAIDVRWLDKNQIKEDFRFRIEPLPFEFVGKRSGLRFAQFAPARCYPVPGEIDPVTATFMLVQIKDALDAAEFLRDLEIIPAVAGMHLPVQRFFPSSRLKANMFQPIPWEDLIVPEIATQVSRVKLPSVIRDA